MAENDAMEGKKLELHMFEQKVLEAIQIAEKQKQDTGVINNGQMQFEIQIEKEGKKVKIHAFGEQILTLEEDEFNYNIEGLKNIQEKLADDPDFDYSQFGLPDIEYLEELEKQKEEQQKEEQQKGEKDLSKDKEEKEQEEPEKEEKTEDESKKQVARRHNVSSSKVTNISTERRVTDKDTLPGIENRTKGYKEVYMVPGEDEYSRDIIGINKDGEEEKIDIKQIQGKNPNDVTIKRADGEEVTKVKPYAMYEIDNKQAIAVIKDSAGKDEWIYCRQEEGRGNEYWGIGIPQKDTRNVHEKPVEAREFMDYRNNSSYDLSKKADSLETAIDLEERGIPSKGGKGVQVEEIEGTPAQNRQMRKEDIIEDLLKRDGIIDRAKAMPGFYENKAEKVLRLMETDDKITYEQAVERVEKSGRQQGGRENNPDDRPGRRQH